MQEVRTVEMIGHQSHQQNRIFCNRTRNPASSPAFSEKRQKNDPLPVS
jgi:hypothetical protein